jgi:hypothetical protein
MNREELRNKFKEIDGDYKNDIEYYGKPTAQYLNLRDKLDALMEFFAGDYGPIRSFHDD